MPDPNTISVELGSNIVTGTGTAFIAAEDDTLLIEGYAFPVLIRLSPLSLRLKVPWLNPSKSNIGPDRWRLVRTGAYWSSTVATNVQLAELLRKFESGPFKWDASGPFSDRALYNDQKKDFVFLATQEVLTLYIKTSDEVSSTAWTQGYQIRNEAESTTEAVAAATQSKQSATAAQGSANAAQGSAGAAQGSATVSTQNANRADAAAADARQNATLLQEARSLPGQFVFSGADGTLASNQIEFQIPGGYTPGFVKVWNGMLRCFKFTATNGTSVIVNGYTWGPGDVVTIEVQKAGTVADAARRSEVDAKVGSNPADLVAVYDKAPFFNPLTDPYPTEPGMYRQGDPSGYTILILK